MTYAWNKSEVGMEFYEVHMRAKQTQQEDPVNAYQVRALANDLGFFSEVFLDNTSVDADVDTNNAVYYCDATAGNIALDLASESIADESAGDVIVFQRTDSGANTVNIDDENALTTSLAVGETAVFKYSTKLEFWLKTVNSTQMNAYTRLGILDEGPAIMTEQGDTRMTAVGYNIFTKNAKFECNDLNVSEESTDFYRSLVTNGNVDIMFYCKENPEKSVFMFDFDLEHYVNVTGNNWNVIPLSGIRETSTANVGNHIQLLTFS